MHVLKESLHRSVCVEESAGTTSVVKRFHSRGVRRVADRWRAARELRALETLRSRGLPVPAAALERDAGGSWSLRMQHVGHRTLADVLARGAEQRVLDAVADLVADFLAADLTHADPHVDNIVLDDRGRPWIVDARGIRSAGLATRARLRGDLATMAAAVRESLEPQVRTRLLVRILRRLPRPQCDLLLGSAGRTALFVELERESRVLRRRAVSKNLDRWERESGVCERVHVEGVDLLRCRKAPRDPVGVVVLEGAAVPDAWRSTARLVEHRIAVATPLWIETRGTARAAFELGGGTIALDRARAGERDPEALFRELGRLLGSLHDRGLRLAALGERGVLVRSDGKPFFAPGVSVDEEPASALDRLAAAAHELPILADASPALRKRLCEGYADALGDETERRALRAELGLV